MESYLTVTLLLLTTMKYCILIICIILYVLILIYKTLKLIFNVTVDKFYTENSYNIIIWFTSLKGKRNHIHIKFN